MPIHHCIEDSREARRKNSNCVERNNFLTKGLAAKLPKQKRFYDMRYVFNSIHTRVREHRFQYTPHDFFQLQCASRENLSFSFSIPPRENNLSFSVYPARKRFFVFSIPHAKIIFQFQYTPTHAKCRYSEIDTRLAWYTEMNMLF